jgi:hypothetical protein
MRPAAETSRQPADPRAAGCDLHTSLHSCPALLHTARAMFCGHEPALFALAHEGDQSMFGFIIGTLCLIALFGTLRRNRYRHLMFAYGSPYGFGAGPFFHGHGYGPGHGFGGGGRWGGYGGGRRGHGRGPGMGRALFAHLDTTPGQEKAIAQAVGTLCERMDGTRDELKATRKQIAAALGGDVLDAAALEAALGRGQAVAQALAHEVSQLLTEVHAALDGEQRKQLAELISDGPPWHGFAHRVW